MNRVKATSDVGVMLITHYTRILRYIRPDFVHVFVDGRIVEEGGPELADRLEDEGYDRFLSARARPDRGSIRMSALTTAAILPSRRHRVGAAVHDEELVRIRADFPILERTVRDGKPLVYLDSGATSQKPFVVLDAEREFYERHNSAVHRGAHQLSEEGTELYERARATIAAFVGARHDEVVFTKNATEGLNLAAYAFSNAAAGGGGGRVAVRAGPRRRGARHRDGAPRQPHPVAGADARAPARPCAGCRSTDDGPARPGRPRRSADRAHQGVRVHPRLQRARARSTPSASSPTGRTPVGALAVLDACQSVPHLPVDVADLGVDLAGLERPQDARPARASACSGAARRSSTRCRCSSPAAR